MTTNIQFPQGPMVDASGYVSLEWREWFQNPQILSINFSVSISVENGGTGLTGGTSGGVLAFTASNVIASSGTLANHAIVFGGGTGGVPATPLGLGTTTQVLHGNAAGAPTWGQVSLTADVSGDLPYANLAQGSALSVLGVTGNATADVASIVAASDGQILRRNGASVGFGSIVSSQITGTTTNNDAAAGFIGEYVFSAVTFGSAVSLTTATTANVTSISLTAGDWDVDASVSFTGDASTTVDTLLGGVGSGSATVDFNPGSFNMQVYNAYAAFNALTGGLPTCPTIPVRKSLASTTTIYLVARADFAIDVCKAYGIIRARRVR